MVEDRHEEDGRETSEEAMLKEVVISNVDGDARWIKKMESSTLATSVIW